MKIKHVKPGDVIKVKPHGDIRRDNRFDQFYETRWIVVKVYDHIVLTRSKRCPMIRRCFNAGDLVIMGIEGKELIRRFEFDFVGSEVVSYGEL